MDNRHTCKVACWWIAKNQIRATQKIYFTIYLLHLMIIWKITSLGGTREKFYCWIQPNWSTVENLKFHVHDLRASPKAQKRDCYVKPKTAGKVNFECVRDIELVTLLLHSIDTLWFNFLHCVSIVSLSPKLHIRSKLGTLRASRHSIVCFEECALVAHCRLCELHSGFMESHACLYIKQKYFI